jgi:hypothetical protein
MPIDLYDRKYHEAHGKGFVDILLISAPLACSKSMHYSSASSKRYGVGR